MNFTRHTRTSLVRVAALFVVLVAPGEAQDRSAPQKTTQPGVQYLNKDYGFRFALPDSWKDYKVVADSWSGRDGSSNGPTEKGPIVVLRNPKWTKDHPTQDIPIMVFTMAQWKKIDNEEMSVSAAPIGPSELGRNSKYVFALPARYDFGDGDDKEEVYAILNGHPLQPL
jgi:hypothetical protein